MPTKMWGKVAENRQRGVWCVKGTWQGKRYYYSGYNTAIGWQECKSQQEAMQLQFIISQKIEEKTFNPLRYKRQKPHHIKRYAERWIESVKNEIAHSTWKLYHAAYLRIISGLGDIYIGDLNYDHIKFWIDSMVDLAPRSKKVYQLVLIRMMGDALKSGHITQMPQFIEWKHGRKIPIKHKETIDSKTQDRILLEIPAHDRHIFRFLFLTGVRVSEARALRKSDIYRKDGYISIRSTFAPRKGGEGLKEVKQKRERRIPLQRDLLALLDETPVYLSSEFVFNYSITGRHYSNNINRDIWNPACRKALGYLVQLNRAGRASFAQQLLDKGVPIETVAIAMGHSDLGKTLTENYADPSTAAAWAVVEAMRWR